MGRREREGAQARAYGEGGQAGRRRQAGRGQVGRDRACGQAGRRGRWRRHPMGEVKRGAAPGCELPDGAPQNKNLN